MAQSDEDFVSQLRDEGRSADEILEALIARRAPAVDQQAADGAELPDAPGLLGDEADPQEAAAAPEKRANNSRNFNRRRRRGGFMAKKLDWDENMRRGTFKWGERENPRRCPPLLNRISPAL